jgi:DNA-binding Lrp family transcriptional regulator
MAVDQLDLRLLGVLLRYPRLGVLECSRRLGVARGTAQARLDRLLRTGVITSLGPQVNPVGLGYTVTAFVTLQLRQHQGRESVTQHLTSIPEVLEAYTITGGGDVLCRVVARSNSDLQQVIDQVVSMPGIERTSTVIALTTEVAPRILPLVEHGDAG